MKHTFILFLVLLGFSGISLAQPGNQFIATSSSFCADEDDKDEGESTTPSDEDEEPDCE